MIRFIRILTVALGLALGLGQVSAVTLPHIFGDHMVLQTGMPVPIWGWGQSGEVITVTFAGQTKQTTTSSTGAWKVTLDPLAISAQGATLSVVGSTTVVFQDVLVGEVWLCAGQSNMQKPLGPTRGLPVYVQNGQAELAAANYPLIRLLNEKNSQPATPATDFNLIDLPNDDYPWKGWVVCTPANLDLVKFSAVGYFFGKKLFLDLNVPVGLIQAAAGGTHVEDWTPSGGFAFDPALAPFFQAAKTPLTKFQGTQLTTHFNGMINPLIPLALRGVLWYQAESNVTGGDDSLYANKIVAMINAWRTAWSANWPLYFVQLPPCQYSSRKSPPTLTTLSLPIVREAQMAALKLPNTGMVVTTDLGDTIDPTDLHPPRKIEIGERLELWALAKNYGRTDIEPSGPMFRSMEKQGSQAILHFDHVGAGLVSVDGQPLNSFTVAGASGSFFPASAAIVGDTVVITCSQVPDPKIVRFGFDEAANPNLFSKGGLPASPFRTSNSRTQITPWVRCAGGEGASGPFFVEYPGSRENRDRSILDQGSSSNQSSQPGQWLLLR